LLLDPTGWGSDHRDSTAYEIGGERWQQIEAACRKTVSQAVFPIREGVKTRAASQPQ
jgi:hypothetical protein